jgi:hypothetical protein
LLAQRQAPAYQVRPIFQYFDLSGWMLCRFHRTATSICVLPPVALTRPERKSNAGVRRIKLVRVGGMKERIPQFFLKINTNLETLDSGVPRYCTVTT